MATTFKGVSMPKSELNAYSVGLLRLQECKILAANFSTSEISYIGECSLNRREIVLGKVGNFWCIFGRHREQSEKASNRLGYEQKFRAYYVITGKRIKRLHTSRNPLKTIEEKAADFECADRSKPLSKMNAKEVFNAGVQNKPRKRERMKVKFRTHISYCVKMERI